MGLIGIVELALVLAALLAVLGAVAVRERKVRRRFQILADLAAVSETGSSLEQTMTEICEVLVPTFADFCMIDVIEDGEVRRGAVRVAPGAPEGTERWIAERRPSVPEHMVAEEGDAALEPRFYERLTDDDLRQLADGSDDLEYLRRLDPRSAITVALKARGQVTGALTLGLAWSGRRYRGEDAHFAWILSGRVALALDNSGLFADLERAERTRARIGETLQRGLLPSPLPHIPGWSVAARYRPAGAENEVGGDFYDVFKVPGGWMLVVGDVTGRGAQAASITAVARYTLRTAAMLDDDPLVALRTLNRVLLARGDAALCSVAALTLSEDPLEPVRLAVAGHPPPLLADGESVEELAAADPVLGAFDDAEWRIVRSEVEPGQQLVIVTDGIAEAQAAGGRFGEARLRRELIGVDNPALAVQRLEAALLSFCGTQLDDDVAIVAIARASDATGASARSPAREEASMADPAAMVEQLYLAFNRRDPEAIVELCDERLRFYPVITAAAVGRDAPYTGREGLREYLDDVAGTWEELLITPSEVEVSGETVLVRGRVYARSRESGIRDAPTVWIWETDKGLFVRGEVFVDPEQGIRRFAGDDGRV